MGSSRPDSPRDLGQPLTEGRTVSAARSWTAPLVITWLLILAAGSAWMIGYQRTPGARGPAVASWPAGTDLVRADLRLTLVMFVHPRCPCSHASIAELERLVRSAGPTFSVQLVFFTPPEGAASWARTGLWSQALRIPGAACTLDQGGVEHRRFGALTSGETFLFDKEGALRFQGGITAGRGEEGDNSGRDALAALLKTDAAPAARTPVFGCALEGPLTSPPCCAAAARRPSSK